ncbi:hypothetical protein TrLO_g3034 [Triparma laevis f. longispina]|uniref:Uncharacterized protein n=1 Tax=Triparma laevis f. longispina TaxID=1714387 RepID=A0A9W7AGH1_9STRA|nr:hypothetical protein TrLO_g3034 [Triparma laevis f. longispina]
MPPKKSKPKRTPHPNETPKKHLAPGHGHVERAKNNMWSTGDTPSSASAVTTAQGSKPKYKVMGSTDLMSIGRGGGGGVKKKVVKPVVVEKEGEKEKEGDRGNPDANFFG